MVYHIFLDHYDFVPTLGKLPAGFSSTGSVLDSRDICNALLNEHYLQSDTEEIALSAYPFGTDTLIGEKLDDVLSFVLFECDKIYSAYTEPLLASLYGSNLLFRWTKPNSLRDEAIQRAQTRSSVKSMEDCITTLKSVIALITHSVDITESMRLPMKITSKLFSRMSILFSIPMSHSILPGLSEYMENAPEMVSIEAWCARVNAGCKLWDEKTITWRRKSSRAGQTDIVDTSRTGWWEWLGWGSGTRRHAGDQEEWSEPQQNPFKPNKAHNVLFAMASVSAMFVYVALVLNSSRK